MVNFTRKVISHNPQSQGAVGYLMGPQAERTQGAVDRFLQRHPEEKPILRNLPDLARCDVNSLSQELSQILKEERGHCDFSFEITRPVYGGLDWQSIAKHVLSHFVSEKLNPRDAEF